MHYVLQTANYRCKELAQLLSKAPRSRRAADEAYRKKSDAEPQNLREKLFAAVMAARPIGRGHKLVS